MQANILIFLFFSLLNQVATAARGESCSTNRPCVQAKDTSTLKLVKTIFSRYQQAAAVKIEIKKRVVSALLEDEKLSEGTLLLSKGRVRLEITQPEHSLVIVDKNVIWVESSTPKELGSKKQVLKIRSKEFAKQSKAPIAMLLGQAKIWDEFKVKTENNKSDEVQLTLVPKKNGAVGEVSSIDLILNKRDKQIRSLSYKDDLENETHFEFKNANFSAAASLDSLKYTPPKDAEITEY